MIKTRRIIKPSFNTSMLSSMKEDDQVTVSRDGQPFIYIHRMKDSYNYGPVDEDCKPLVRESLTIPVDNIDMIIGLLKLNKDHQIQLETKQ